MGAEDRKHAPLILMRQMEEAVPGDQPVEVLLECELAHVADLPVLVGKTLAAKADQCRRRIDAGQRKTLIDQVAGDWLA
jgi:hypothetical protein